MDEALSLAAIADKVGTVFLGVALVYALWKQHIVFGWTMKECQVERDRYRVQTEERMGKMEEELNRLRDG